MVTRISGNDAFSATTAGVASGATAPTPPLSETSYWYANTAGTADYQRWSGLTPADAWQFRRLVHVSTAVLAASGHSDLDLTELRGGSDATNKLIVRVQGTDKMRVVDSTGAYVFTSTPTFPHDANLFYRLDGYGNANTGIGRVALFPLGSSTPVSGFDTGEIAMPMGGTGGGPTGIRLGHASGAGTWPGKSAWCRDEFYTGTDAAFAFKGPYGSNVAPTAAPAGATGAAVKLTANAADSDGTVVSYAWSITSVPSGGTPTVYDATSSTAHFLYTVPGNYGISLTVIDNSGASTTATLTYNAPSPTATATPFRFFYDLATTTWVAA